MRIVLPPQGAFDHAPKLQYVPILLGDDGFYPIEANRYLDERCNGEWTLPGKKRGDVKIPTLKSRMDIASRLGLFLVWAGRQKMSDWRTFSYQDKILQGYQLSLITGKGSASGRKLDPMTINLYVSEACLFLGWAAERGYRSTFNVPSRRTMHVVSAATSARSMVIEGSRRAGEMSGQEKPLVVPSNEEVERWLLAARVRSPIKSLVFELIIRCGLRISEANRMRVSCFPDKLHEGQAIWNPAWTASGAIPVTIKYGTKGGKVTPASDLGTSWRTAYVPLDLAERIWHYKSIVRPTMLSRLRRRENESSYKTDRLWLGESKQRPVSNEMLRRTWMLTPHCPQDWHPHTGRHFYAVDKLCDLTRAHLSLKSLAVSGDADFGWLHGLLAGQIQMILAPLMGHVSGKTTMQYLRSAVAKIARDKGHPSIRWNAMVDG